MGCPEPKRVFLMHISDSKIRQMSPVSYASGASILVFRSLIIEVTVGEWRTAHLLKQLQVAEKFRALRIRWFDFNGILRRTLVHNQVHLVSTAVRPKIKIRSHAPFEQAFHHLVDYEILKQCTSGEMLVQFFGRSDTQQRTYQSRIVEIQFRNFGIRLLKFLKKGGNRWQ